MAGSLTHLQYACKSSLSLNLSSSLHALAALMTASSTAEAASAHAFPLSRRAFRFLLNSATDSLSNFSKCSTAFFNFATFSLSGYPFSGFSAAFSASLTF